MLDDITNTNPFTAAASILGGGALVGWFRERRMGRRDAQNFALEFLREQSLRIDKLVEQVAHLEADKRVAEEALEIARQTIHDLRGDLFKEKAENSIAQHEITRLKTALGEHERHGA